MSRKIPGFIAVIALALALFISISGPAASEGPPYPPLPPGFGEISMTHIHTLTSLGTRSAGSAAEDLAAGYLLDAFDEMGIQARAEEFAFASFELNSSLFRIGGVEVETSMICFDPYAGKFEFEGEMVISDGDGALPPGIERGRSAVLIPASADAFAVMKLWPELMVIVSDEDHAAVIGRGRNDFSIMLEGKPAEYSSVNVIAGIGSGMNGEIVISSHIDSYDNLGADDNASGMAVMLELARYFRIHGAPDGLALRFIAFGAEELGAVGSRAYVRDHDGKLEDIRMVINLDTIGGSKFAAEAISGAGLEAVPRRGKVEGRIASAAFEGSDRKWRILSPKIEPYFMPAYYPPWLGEFLQESARGLGFEIALRGPMGGDQMVFEQAGVVSTALAAFGNPIHTPEDTIEKVDPESLDRIGRLTALLVLEIAERVRR